MKKFILIQLYNCDKRRRLIVQVQDTITGEYYHFTEEEWELRKSDCYTYEETEIFRVELRAKTYLLDVSKTQKRRKK